MRTTYWNVPASSMSRSQFGSSDSLIAARSAGTFTGPCGPGALCATLSALAVFEPAVPGGEPAAPGGEPAAPGGEPAAPGGEPAAPGGEPAVPGGEPAVLGVADGAAPAAAVLDGVAVPAGGVAPA